MSGSHYANAPAQYGAYFSAAPDGTTRYDLIAMAASDARLGRVLGNPPAETTQYDLRTLPERDADELAAPKTAMAAVLAKVGVEVQA